MSGFLIFLISISRVFYSAGVQNEAGSCKFAEVIESPEFVDKSMMIKDFFQNPRMSLITAPRRFGKTINMDMIRRFCELKVSEKGTRIPKKETDTYKLFTQHNLNIYDPSPDSFFNKHFGEYPVVHISFKTLAVSSFRQFYVKFKKIVTSLFRSHEYFLQSKWKKRFKTFLDWNKKICRENLDELGDGIQFLTEILHRHFKKNVIVLIDEFDVPVQSAIFNAGKDTGDIINFITLFTGDLLKDNEFVERALINACIRLSGILTYGANNVHVYRFADSHVFNMYNGFTEEEVFKIAVKCNCTNKTEGIKEWYDGYNVAKNRIKLYNVWSIVNFMHYKVLRNYWAESDYVLQLRRLSTHFIIFNHFVLLLTTNQTEIGVIEKLSIRHVEYLKKLIPNPEITKVTLQDSYIFLNLMLDLGYFTIVNRYKALNDSSTEHKYKTKVFAKFYSITIPNKEIREEIEENLALTQLLNSNYNISETFRTSYITSILNLGKKVNSYKTFLENVRMLIERTQNPENEAEFEDILSFIIYLDQREYSIKIHAQVKTPNRKFADVLIYSILSSTGIIIEVKHCRSTRGGAYEGLKQIVGEKRYYQALDKYKVRIKIFIGMYYNEKGECSLSYLFNTTDINKAVNVTLE